MSNQYKDLNILTALLLATTGALIADTFASIVGMEALIKPQNLLSDILVIASSLLINGMVYATAYILDSEITLLKIVWFLSLLVDAYTTFIAIFFEVLLNSDTVDWTLIKVDSFNSLIRTIAVLTLSIAISLMAMCSGYLSKRK